MRSAARLRTLLTNQRLNATVIDGSSAYTPTQLFAAYRDHLGRPINTSNAQAIIAQIEALYLRDGYSRPEFRLDDDLAAAGILRIEVFEAQITRVDFSGDAGPYAARLEELASELSLRVPLRTADLQAALQAMRELPGLTVRATHAARRVAPQLLRADGGDRVQADRRDAPAFESRHARDRSDVRLQPGRRRTACSAGASGSVCSPRPRPIRTSISGGGVFFDVPVTEAGTHLTTTAFKTQSNPTEEPDRDDRYDRERMSLRASGTLDSTSAAKLGWSAGFDWDDLDITRDDDAPANREAACRRGRRSHQRPDGDVRASTCSACRCAAD